MLSLTAPDFAAADVASAVVPDLEPVTPRASLLIDRREIYICLNDFCDESEIPAHCITKAMNRRTGIRTVTATCPHCRRSYAAHYDLRGGMWELRGAIQQFEPEPANPFHQRLHNLPAMPPSVAVQTIDEPITPPSAVITPEEAVALAPSEHDRPAVEQLDTDCDTAAARAAEQPVEPTEPQRTIDTSTSQVLPDRDGDL